MPFIEEESDRPVEEEIVDIIKKEGYVILTRSDDDDSCCMVVSCKWGNDYEPDDDWYNDWSDDLWVLYQQVDIQWAYRDSSVNSPNWGDRTATILLPR